LSCWSSNSRQRWSPTRKSVSVDETMSVNSTVASIRSVTDCGASPAALSCTGSADAIGRAARRASGDLSQIGLSTPYEGVFARGHRLGQAPTLQDMDVIDAVRDGSIEVGPPRGP
jgi:hypothetical protein